MNDNDCPICYFDLGYIPEPLDDPWLPIITPCDHIFHYRCLLQWGKGCPLCRHPLEQTSNIIESTIYIHSPKCIKRIVMKINQLDTIATVKQLIQENINIPASEMNIYDIHTRYQGSTLEIFPISHDTQTISKIIKDAHVEKFYVSFRVILTDSIGLKIDNRPKRYGFHKRPKDPKNLMEFINNPEPESECVLL